LPLDPQANPRRGDLFWLEDVTDDRSFALGYEEVDEHGWSPIPTKLPRLALNKNYLLVQLT